jgi:putative tricarboxylic transport membrane protein
MFGTVMGTLVGALPGLGPTAGMAVLLPFAFTLNPTSALIMLGGIYYGAMYGGTITAVLLNIPGESDAIWTALEGHKLARKGRAGAVLIVAATVSFFAGTVSLILLVSLAPMLASWALSFGPAEQFGVLLIGLAMISGLSSNAPIKGWMMLAFGLGIGMVGLDIVTGMPRFTFGSDRMLDGLDFLPVTVGLFGVADVLANVERNMRVQAQNKVGFRDMLPTRDEWRRSRMPAVRGTLLGFFMGIIPGSGTTMSSTASYAIEQKVSKRKEEFGNGAIEGIAGPESANNAATSGAMVPILALGVPGSPATAVLFGAMLMQGLRPGPLMFKNNPDVIWGFLASMYVGNVILVLLNTLFIPFFTKMTVKAVPIINAIVLALCIVGVFAFRNSLFDVGVMLTFGVIGYFLNKLNYPTMPLILGIVLGDVAELTLRQSLIISRGDPMIFFSSPISATLMTIAIMVILSPLFAMLRRRWIAKRSPAAASLNQ